MNLETASDQSDVKESSISLPFPNVWWGRVLYGIYITVLPILAFWATEVFKPEWQSGELSDYIILFLFPEASLVFFLLLAYSIICYLLLLIAPTRYSQLFFIRFGIYTGFLLALQYSILSGLFFFNSSFDPSFILLWISPIVFGVVYRWAIGKWNARAVAVFLILFVVGSFLISALIVPEPLTIPVFLLIALTLAAPFWSFLLALRAAIWLFKNNEMKLGLPQRLGMTAWIAAYIAAWRFDILKMYELYAVLPPTPPPDCYIATAAAHGHPQFVHAWTIQHGDGKSMQVNTQLQCLKCAELALLAIHPRFHRSFRKIYDVMGKPLARRIQNPFIADMAYLLLRPWEWLAGLILKTIVPEIDSISKKLYTN